MSSHDPTSVARKIIQGLLLPRDEAMVEDLLETYRGSDEFVDFRYGRMREVSIRSSAFLGAGYYCRLVQID